MLVQSLEQQLLGQRVTRDRVIKPSVGLDEPAIGREQAEVCPLLAKVDTNL